MKIKVKYIAIISINLSIADITYGQIGKYHELEYSSQQSPVNLNMLGNTMRTLQNRYNQNHTAISNKINSNNEIISTIGKYNSSLAHKLIQKQANVIDILNGDKVLYYKDGSPVDNDISSTKFAQYILNELDKIRHEAQN